MCFNISELAPLEQNFLAVLVFNPLDVYLFFFIVLLIFSSNKHLKLCPIVSGL